VDTHHSLLSGLNKEQQEAVTAPPDGHYLILAGAGCGKTTVLTRRVAYLASCGVPLSSILALTFTRKAADEMAGRVSKLTEEFRRDAGEPTITTFHAFALRVLGATVGGRSNFNRIGFSGTTRTCDEVEQLQMLAACCSAEERRRLGVDVVRLEAMIERHHLFPGDNGKRTPEDVRLLQSIARRYQTRKQELGVWDFSDLIEGVVTLFDTDPQVADYFRERFKAVLVDEFQDTNPLQVRLLHQLLADGKRLFAVGDDDQAIYGFRGADIRPTLEFSSDFSGARIIKLQTNYRSVPALLDKANRIFKNKDPAYRKLLKSGRYPGREGIPPSIHRFENQEQMGAWIVAQAKSCAAQLQIPAAAMTVLFRTNQAAGWMETYFGSSGMSAGDCPQVLTVHKSKGLEFPVVFLCDMEESVFPGYRQPSGRRIRTLGDLFRHVSSGSKKKMEGDLDEETRLFYVAVTRAQQRLFLLSVRTKSVYGRTRRFEPSRFLAFMR
jgi:DNA helicase-2/ATP-dependent DNA helicase PcrA